MLDFFDYQMPDNQARDLKYQVNQYLSEILIVTLDSHALTQTHAHTHTHSHTHTHTHARTRTHCALPWVRLW